jgi:glycosyltransferase involved in cell wall biosynthesis
MDYIMITPSYPPRVGGVEKHVFEVHAVLQRSGFRGLIVVLKDRPPDAERRDDVIWIGVRKLWGCVPKTARLLTMWKFVQLICEYKPRIIHFHDSTIYPMVPLLRGFGLLPKTYMTFHGWEGVCPPAPAMIQKRQKIAKTVRGTIAIGDFIQKWYGTVSDIVNYGGVNVECYGSLETIDYDPKDLHIAYFGRLEPDTGILEIIEAIREFGCKSGKRVKLDIYGKGSLRDKLLSIMEEEPSVGITVYPPVKDTATIFARYKIVVASGYLTILEALCAKRIVFAQYNNALREDYLRMHPAASSMFICMNADDFLGAISQCRSDPEGVMAKCQMGWDWAKQQSWESVARAYIELWGI